MATPLKYTIDLSLLNPEVLNHIEQDLHDILVEEIRKEENDIEAKRKAFLDSLEQTFCCRGDDAEGSCQCQ